MNSMNILNDAIVGLVLVGILVGIWSLYNIWLGCEEDRMEEIIAARGGISPSTMRDVYNAYVVECHRTAMKPDSYLKYMKDFIAEYENG